MRVVAVEIGQHFSEARLISKTSCGITNAITTRAELTPGEMVLHLRKLPEIRWYISAATDGKSIVVVCFSCRWRLEFGFRQVQVAGSQSVVSTVSTYHLLFSPDYISLHNSLKLNIHHFLSLIVSRIPDVQISTAHFVAQLLD